MHFSRQEAAAVTLPNRMVLVAGGNNGSVALRSCELYDPNTNTWTVTGSMNEGRYRFPMVLLKDGRVLAAGGLTDLGVGTSPGCEIYDPTTGAWTSMNPMSDARENFPALVLPNGKVFLDGGLNANIPVYLSSCELFDPQTNSYQELASMPTPFFGQIAMYDDLHNQIIINGGSNGGLSGLYWPTTQIYDIATDNWNNGPDSYVPHDASTFSEMWDKGLLCAGGRSTSYVANDVVEVLRPPYQEWDTIGHLTSPRWHGAVVLVKGDTVIMIGGNNNPGVNTNVYDSTNWIYYNSKRIVQGPRLLAPRSLFVTAVSSIVDKEDPCRNSVIVYVFGGLSKSGILKSCEALALGPNWNVPALSTNLISIQDSNCSAALDSLKIYNPRCDSLVIDSIVFTGKNAQLFSSKLDGKDTLLKDDSTLVSVMYNPTTTGTYSDNVNIFCHYDSVLDTLIAPITVTLSQPPASLSTASLRYSGTVCAADSSVLWVKNPACDTIWIDSVTFTGADSARFTSYAGQFVPPSDSVVVVVGLGADLAGNYSGTAHIYYHGEGQQTSQHLDASLLFTITGITIPSIHAYLRDTTAFAGDTISVPIELVGNTPTMADGLTMHLGFNTDLLTMLDPDFQHSLDSNASFDDINNKPGVGADLTVPGSVQLRTGKLLTLRFATYVTKTSCTTLDLSSLVFSPDDPLFSTCVLSSLLDSATICVDPRCGNIQVQQLMLGNGVGIDRISVQENILTVEFHGSSTPDLELYDLLGVRVTPVSVHISPGLATLNIGTLPVGPYFVRMNWSGGSLRSGGSLLNGGSLRNGGAGGEVRTKQFIR